MICHFNSQSLLFVTIYFYPYLCQSISQISHIVYPPVWYSENKSLSVTAFDSVVSQNVVKSTSLWMSVILKVKTTYDCQSSINIHQVCLSFQKSLYLVFISVVSQYVKSVTLYVYLSKVCHCHFLLVYVCQSLHQTVWMFWILDGQSLCFMSIRWYMLACLCEFSVSKSHILVYILCFVKEFISFCLFLSVSKSFITVYI